MSLGMRVVALIAWAVIAITVVYFMSQGAESAAPEKPIYHEYSKIIITRDEDTLLDETYLDPLEEHMRKKRSMAIGRTGWRPGKRSSRAQRWLWVPSDHEDLLPKPADFDRGQPEEMLVEEPQHKTFITFPWSAMHKRSVPLSSDINLDFNFDDVCGLAAPSAPDTADHPQSHDSDDE